MQTVSLLKAILGLSCFLCWTSGMVCAVFVRRCVDPDKIKQEEGTTIVRFMNSAFIPSRILTPTGRKLRIARNILLPAGLLLALLIILFVH